MHVFQMQGVHKVRVQFITEKHLCFLLCFLVFNTPAPSLQIQWVI